MKAAEVAVALDGRAVDVLRHLFPGGKVIGHEFCIGDLAGNAGESLKVNLNGKRAVWSDFATGEAGGDLLDLWSQARCGGDLKAAMIEAAGWLGLGNDHRNERPRRHAQFGVPDHIAEYTTAAGRTIGYVYRWNAKGDRKKEIRPLREQAGRWSWAGFDEPRPLYRLADLAARPNAEVLVVEGELKADIAGEIFPDYCITTWPHGKESVDKADLSALKGRRIVCWPDADTDGGGTRAMVKFCTLAIAAGATAARVVALPDGLPDGWDVANPLPEGWTQDTLDALVCDAPRFTPTEAPADDPQGDDLGEWDAADDAERQIPPRAWLLGSIFARCFLSSLLGDGGVGKTALRILQLLSLATGRPLCGDHVFQRCRVLIVSLEDDADELRRRIRAAMIHYNIKPDEVRGWLYLAAPGAKGWKLAVADDGAVVRSVLAGKLADTIVRRRIDIVSLDPFVKAHAVEENDNGAIDQVAQILIGLAYNHNIAVDAPHHISKGPADAGNANRGRGAGSFKNAGRLVYTLTPMTPEEAQTFGVEEEERRLLIRMDSGKVNIAPPASTARWFRLVGVRLGNATDLYPHGDEVQTVDPWTPPDTWKGLSSIALNNILTAIDNGMPNGELYSSANGAGERAAWKVVVEHIPERTEKQARQIIGTWLKSGVLINHAYQSPSQRRERQGLKVDHSKRPT